MPTKPHVSVATAMNQIDAERRETSTARTEQLRRVNDEIVALRRAKTNIEAQITELESHHEELSRQQHAVQEMVVEQGQRAIFNALTTQQQSLMERARQYSQKVAARDEEMLTSLASSGLAAEYEEYRQFKQEIEPTLSALPASYRSVVLRHHHQVLQRLRSHVEGALRQPVELNEERLDLDIVLAVDPFDEGVLALILVLPVSGRLASDWALSNDDLESAFAYRVTQGVHSMWRDGRPQAAPLVVGEHQGLLVLEMDVTYDGAVDTFVERFMASLRVPIETANELRGAGVSASICLVDIDSLLPPSESEPATEDAPTERYDFGGRYAE